MKKVPFLQKIINVIFFSFVVLIVTNIAAFAVDDSSKISIPSGLSKDTRFLLYYMDKRFEQVDKRFELMDERFEQVDKRFEQVDKRFGELREDINSRFEQVNKRFIELREDINKRFELMDERFKQMDKHFEEQNNYFKSLINIMMAIVGSFAGIVAITIGFAIWDRRSMTRPFEDKIKSIEKDIFDDREKLQKLLDVLIKLSKTDSRLAEILKSFALL